MTNAIFAKPLPIVPLFVPLNTKAAWAGKWGANIQSEAIKNMGGPWATQNDACKAILALGTHRLRPGMPANNPHFDRI